MAGNARSGRRPKDLTAAPDKPPRRPTGLTPEGRKFWNRCIKPAAHLGVADSDLCCVAVELWCLWRSAVDAARSAPTDRQVRIAVCGYSQRLTQVMGQLGLDPLGRARMKPDAARDKADPLSEFLGGDA